MGERYLNRASLALIAATVAAVIITVVALLNRTTDTEPPSVDSKDKAPYLAVPLPTPSSVERDGTTYVVAQVPPAAASAQPSGRTVSLYVFDDYSADAPECSSFDSTVRLVEEDDTTVTVAAFTYHLPDLPDVVMCGSIGDERESFYGERVIRLQQRLGDRHIIDAFSGEVVGQLNGQLPPEPSYLPDGYEPALLQGADEESDFVGVRQYRGEKGVIEIQLRSATATAMTGEVVGLSNVAGVEATFSEDERQRCLSWTQSPGVAVELCSGYDEKLDSDELQRIADSMLS